MSPIEEDFRPQTLPQQLREIWNRSGIGNHRRLWIAVIGWGIINLFLSAAIYAWHWANSAGWVPPKLNIGPIGTFIFTFSYALQRNVTLIGIVHFVLWSQWRAPNRPPTWQLILGVFLFGFYSMAIQYAPFFTHTHTSIWVRSWVNYLVTCAWYVLLFRSTATFVGHQLVEADRNDTSPNTRRDVWSLRGMFLAATLVASTIAIKRWIHVYFIETDPLSMPGYSVWINVSSEIAEFITTVLLVYAVVAIVTRRGILVPASLVFASAVIDWSAMHLTSRLLPAFYGRAELSQQLSYIGISITTIMMLHWIAFRVWRWAGYQLREVSPNARTV
ncbi:hypothetical protein [Aporhodopirellula aestuarii]|uniref:Uncharacterized protein n=1 Tax=Aporhodopirellula aestuarii TaxID=2950107 RepID=A0ABT0U3J2_9BACT|nr:hypothetical protein [Aporhodopirellula aestuarii]MCM2371229.1 hypothetical protein [Aporhodopirellula aestuarii]